MPKPRAGESQSHFMNRCIPQVIADGSVDTQKQAVGRCMGIWSDSKKEMAMSNARKKRKLQALADNPREDKEMEQLTDVEAEAEAKSFLDEIPNMYQPEPILVDKERMVKVTDETKETEKMAIEADVMPSLPFGGAQSWDELKEYMDAENVSNSVRQAKYEFSVMVNNVLNDPDLDVSAKGEKIKALAEGFSGRADENVEKDIEPDLLTKVLSAIGLEDFAKARMTAASINNLPDSKFAYIEPGGKKDDEGKTVPRSLRHYPIHDAAHVRNALARAAQQIKKGGKSGDIARRAMSKIKAAAKKLGIGKSSGFIVQKDLAGNYRWMGWVSNKYRDRDKGAHPKGEIISEAAHKEFVSYVDADPTNRMPSLWIWHTPMTATKHRADLIDYADGFLIESGQLTKEEGELFEHLEKQYDLAMSHGFFKDDSSYDTANGIINKYRQFEASVLPREHVANEWTDFATLQEVKDMFTPTKRKFLVDALGEEKVLELEASTKDMAEELKSLGVEFKEAEEDETQPVEVEETEELEPEDGKGLNVSALNKFLETQNAKMEGQDAEIKELKGTIETIKSAIVALVKSDDEKIAEQITPKAHVMKEARPIWERAASKSSETLINEDNEADQKLLGSKPMNIPAQPSSEEDKTAAGWVRGALGAPTDPGASVPMN